MDGLFSSSNGQEVERSGGFMRHRLLRINTGSTQNPGDASIKGSTTMAPPSSGNNSLGPHFVMSPETPDGSKSYGIEWFVIGDNSGAAGMWSQGVAGAGVETGALNPYTVTIWELIGNASTAPNAFNSGGVSQFFPIWASFQDETGVMDYQLFHSFDINATAVRLQVVSTAGAPVDGSLIIGFCEL